MIAQTKLESGIENLEDHYSQEKVYLMFDKDEYIAGDALQFKSFVFDGYEPSKISNTMFVELYDNDKKLIDKKTILLKDGHANGAFTLKEDLKENIYFIRAYSSWMANFDDSWNFLKAIPIYNPDSKEKLELHADESWEIDAFPEGGNFVADLQMKIAVRFYTSDNSSQKWTGYLIDENEPNNKIAIQTLDQNVGVVEMTPKSGKTYQIVITDQNGNSKTKNLPQVSDYGISLKTKNEEKGISYILNSRNSSEGLKNHHVVAIFGNKLVYLAKLPTNSSQIKSIIPKEAVENAGILQIYVFDGQFNLVAEKLCMINPLEKNKSAISVSKTQINQTARAKNILNIETDSTVKDLGILINSSDDNRISENILSNIYLTQDFKSAISFPAQYFEENANKDALDALLISEKWKRYDWKKVLNAQKPVIKYDVTNNKFISYIGKLALNSRPLPNTLLNLFITSESGLSELVQETTNQKGEIELFNIDYDEPLMIHYYLNDNKKVIDNLTLTLKPLIPEKNYQPAFPKTDYRFATPNDEIQIPKSVSQAFENRKNNKIINGREMQIEEVKLVKKKTDATKKLNDELTSSYFSSMNATIFDLVNDHPEASSASNALQWLQGRVAGLTFSNDTTGNLTPYIRNNPVNIYIDEMKLDVDALYSVQITDIALIKIIKGSSFVGNAILIYTRRGNHQKNEKTPPSQNNKISLKAYDKMPPYSLKNLETEVYPFINKDLREVLYWNPSLPIINNRSTEVIFYNNDTLEKRNATIIGIDFNNNIIYQQIKLD